MKKVSIIIPAYNEEKTVRRVVENVLQVNFPIDYEIIIVDDYSRDRTYRIAKILNQRDLTRRIRLYRNEKNRGKGYSIRYGISQSTGDMIVVQDADFEYDPQEIPKLMQPLIEEKSSVVYGSRFLFSKNPPGMAFPNKIANRFLTWLTNVLYGTNLTDMETCYKLVKREVIENIQLKTERFDFEPEITAKILKNGYKIMELPIGYHGRSASEGKKIKARDFFIAVWVLLKNRMTK